MEEQDPFAEGADARFCGQSETANPYPLETHADAHASWNDGWASVDQDDE